MLENENHVNKQCFPISKEIGEESFKKSESNRAFHLWTCLLFLKEWINFDRN